MPSQKIIDIAALPDDALLNRIQMAAVSGFTVAAFKKWAAQGRGPRIVRVEGNPRTRVADFREWLSGQGG